MAILALPETRILVHGIGNPLARFQCEEMLRHGTRLTGIVAVDPGDTEHWHPPNIPVFQSAWDAMASVKADLSMIFSPPYAVKSEVSEAVAAGIPIIVCLTEHVPLHDAVLIRHLAKRAGVTLIGPNSSGVLSPGRAKAGFFVEDICLPGNVGVITKSGSLAYAALAEMKSAGIGISTVVAIGGDVVKGTGFREHLALFHADLETQAVVLLGEIGGCDEEQAAAFIRDAATKKPVVAFISGRSVPLGHSMGHAGAIAERGRGDYHSKSRALAAAGVHVAENIGEIPRLLKLLPR
ncbi:MAG TPA: succinate--CoA ligase subunit alpha [Dongiaceae bacterium]|jgi:succinyl-CoA synthetase alpha subunit|nr:succinate--CoA ligase subunit alpha [Dongiaceae bacterium]